MPTYQYRCTDCGRDLEVVQSFSDASLTECPTCAGRLRKVFGSVGVVFKGSGFYKNDSRSSSSGGSVQQRPKDTPGESTGAGSSSDAGGSSGSDTSSSSSSDSSSSSSTGVTAGSGAGSSSPSTSSTAAA
ncbi:FmdB family transcriptional regulator [Frankia sp. Ag45/Mut15]|uniref:FmdB family transcriptional regulator n=1 Tax=Frankia umida TaxID=573489 RepID=A0ABT0JSM3_9ACTN|nr:FmdB family zinc ribbon protein [Frankia umida]MCK9874197.1 FmdB family transcriptional regulator [Frankia umida]